MALVVAVACAACGGDRGPGEWEPLGEHAVRDLASAGSGGVGFEVRPPESTGITAANQVPPEVTYENRTLADGSGVAIGDYDGDGLPDVFIARVVEPSVLYRNLGDWRFEDVTAASGVALEGRRAAGAAFVDVDTDGDLDLFVTALGQPNVLLRNDGGSFTDVSEAAGFSAVRASRSFSFGDVDGDGDLDLYVVNNKTRVARDLFPPEERSRDRVVVRDDGRCEAAPDLAEHWEVRCFGPATSWLERAEADEFYLNDGDGTFTPVPFTGGRFLDGSGRPLERAPTDWGLSVRFHDLDDDGAVDLWVCNDFETPDRIWMNDGAGVFRAASTDAIRTTSLACMALDFADVDRDGLEDVFTADMEPLGRVRRLETVPPLQSDTTPPGAVDTRVQRARNTLQLARGDGTYADVAPLAGVTGSEWTWASFFLDVDLDGYEDLLTVNGHVWDLLGGDVGQRVGAARASVDWRREQSLYPPLPVRNFAFRNRGDATFEEIGSEWGFGPAPDVSHGMAAGDLDLDGDADLVITRLDAAPLVLENVATAPRIAVRLDGPPENPAGVGAEIRVRGGATPLQVRTLAIARSYLSGSEPQIAFAAGTAGSVGVEVLWPDGRVSRVDAVEPGHLLRISAASAVETGGTSGGDPVSSVGDEALPMFEPLELAHTHTEPSSPELGRQVLIPERLAQLGPGVSALDFDRDGDPDLAIGSGRDGRLALFRNDDGRLVALPPAGAPTPLDQTTILGIPGVAARLDLLVGRMSYEALTPDAARDAPAVVRRSVQTGEESEIVPGGLESVGPLALADVDGDGDLDLFVGGRAFPGRYPAPASSRMFMNDGGAWRPHAVFNTLLADVGVVSSALFSDIDADGDQDLVLAPDWGSIRVYRNEAGAFRDATRALGLDGLTGRWNGLASGDLNGDGLPDLIATSWGLNTGFEASAEHPLVLYHGDLDGNGAYEAIRARFDEEIGAEGSLEPLAAIGRGLPAVLRNVGSYSEYANASIQTLLGPAASGAARETAITLAHTLLMNRGGGFDASPLPMEAQLAPSFYAGVADHDGDGHEDVFLTQNFFATVPGVARYDAGRSLWLAGDGTGALSAVPGDASAIAVYGDPRGAALADFDADGRIDLVVSQNGAPTRLFHNVRAAPGLRVRLVGPSDNPDAIGASMRMIYEGGEGPVREVQAGSGYWSVNEALQVMGLRGEPRAVRVRWPDGTVEDVPVPPGAHEVVATFGASGG